MSNLTATVGQVLSCIRYHEEMADRLHEILDRMKEDDTEVSATVINGMMQPAETRKMTATVQNVPANAYRYVTALPFNGALWYYGSFKTLEGANAQLMDKEANPDSKLLLVINEEAVG